MKERPIGFNEEMVRAILDGKKTQTRRPIKQQYGGVHDCPYGKVGDRLWVRETSRITLEITNVRIERVQDISEHNAKAEGVMPDKETGGCVDAFMFLWDEIYASKGFGWDANPWVWVIEFKKMEG